MDFRIGSWGKRNREIVSFRSCVHMCGLVVRWELAKIEPPRPLSLFLFSQDGISFEFSVDLVSPGEI